MPRYKHILLLADGAKDTDKLCWRAESMKGVTFHDVIEERIIAYVLHKCVSASDFQKDVEIQYMSSLWKSTQSPRPLIGRAPRVLML